jgi:hypothetical protein
MQSVGTFFLTRPANAAAIQSRIDFLSKKQNEDALAASMKLD